MTLDAGTRLGPYEVLSRIGAGGMGEVFKARDTRLDRAVAIKVLPREFSQNAQLRVRFEREARAISQLTHPNICTLHDIGSDNGVSYLVMELLDGESLADRLTRGQLPMSEVIRLGAQIADALAKAHRAGIVHRDLKPGNIMLTRSGVKLLDFGLAKIGPAVTTSGESPALGETEQRPLTERGTILGTFQYMSPEQLEGEDVDPRTDIFALGAVLYEMSTGQRAFQGKNKTSLIAAIVSSDPRNLRELQPLTPPAFEHVVARCLKKDREERWQNAQDIAEQLRWISESGSAAGVAAAVPSRRFSRELVAWLLVALLLPIAAIAAWHATRPQPRRLVQRTTIPLLPGREIREGLPSLAISPDGTQLVYRGSVNGVNALFTRALAAPAWQELAGAAGGTPFFSPDGKWIGFFGANGLRKIPAAGGSPVTLAEAANHRGATWAEDGTIYFSPTPSSGIWRVSGDGGQAEEFTKLDRNKRENSHRWPQALPGGTHILVTVRTSNISSFDDARIVAVSTKDGTSRTVLEGGTFARYAPTGHLLFVRGQALYAAAFDPKTLETSGTPVQVITNLHAQDDMGSAHYAFSSRGSLGYLQSIRPSKSDLASVISFDASGATKVLGTSPRFIYTTRPSPDGRFIAARISAANDDISILDIARKTFTRLTFEDGDEWDPVWSSDGRSVFYTWSTSDSDHRLVVRAADGSGEPRTLARNTLPIVAASVSPDGRWVACQVNSAETGSDIAFISTADGSRRMLVKTPFHEFAPRFSPDGKWLAYGSLESGRPEVYVRSVEPGGGRWQVSTQAGREPRWTPDGKWIVYSTVSRQIFRVAVEDRGDSLSIGTPQQVANAARLSDFFEIAPDGRFIGVISGTDAPGATAIQYVENWFEELDRRVPTP